ncbi:MAG: acetylglutamate kinase [Cryomorphaceae bacterium]|jgi:acetylglutamate kinase
MNSNSKPIAVVKVGGDMLLKAADREGLAANLKDLVNAGWQCVVLHGGGPQLNSLQALYGLKPNKIAGRRITSQADIKVVKQALCGEVNVDLVAALIAQGLPAFGCHGASGQLIQAQKRPPIKLSGHGAELVDFGEVGDITGINTSLLHSLLEAGQIPVIASLGINQDGRVFNINADTTVAAIALALKADLLILSTMVGGIFADIKDPSSRYAEVSPQLARKLINDGIITDGMIPKVEEALGLLSNGVAAIAICNASQKGGFVDIANHKGTVGTRLVGK